MGQVTIYLDDKTEDKARAAARAEGVPLSKWVAQRIQRPARGEWPEAVRALAGAWPDLPSAERIRKASKTKDAARARL
ncbi:MAG: CopG family transcriptional regulator [Burkholderiales bacterium]